MLMKHTVLAVLAATLTTVASAAPQHDLVGNWCFYEQEGSGQKLPEKVDIAFDADGSYVWKEGQFQQTGRWVLENGRLEMSDVGSHHVLSIGHETMELKRGSTMRFRKEKCASTSFGDQDIIRFHNAASTGNMTDLQASLDSGIGINIVDHSRGDTALIKAAKFCRINAAHALLAKGADSVVKNLDGKTALDYANKSSFHKGCDELVKRLQ